MDRKSLLLAGVFVIAIAVVSGCHHDSNTVTGPLPPAPTSPPGVSTPTPGAVPTPTPAPAGSRVVNVGQGGGTSFTDQQSGNSTTTIPVGTTVQWVWVTGTHSTTSGTCNGACTPDGVWNSGVGSNMTFTHTFTQRGTFPYFCMVHQSMMTGSVVVQ